MSFLRRLFSADLRAAVTAEAAGDLGTAAESYARAGELGKAVRIHMERADRAESRSDEIEALREAHHWARTEGDLHQRTARRLGSALLARAKAEVVTTSRDKDRVKEAARFLKAGGDYRTAGDALLSIGETDLAADAYRAGGHVEAMETTLLENVDGKEKRRQLRSVFADYEVALSGGERRRAQSLLSECVELASKKREYIRILDDLNSRMLDSKTVRFRVRKGPRSVVTCSEEITIGRDTKTNFPLRSPGISRVHLRILRKLSSNSAAKQDYILEDAGSKSGVLLDGLPVLHPTELSEKNTISLSKDCELTCNRTEGVLVLTVQNGFDKGAILIVGESREDIPIEFIGANINTDAAISFSTDYPRLRHPTTRIFLNDQTVERGDIELISGDIVRIGDAEFEIE